MIKIGANIKLNHSRFEKLQILLVDDDRIFSLIHKNVLKQVNIDKSALCMNGKEALEYLDSQSESTGTFLVLLNIKCR